MHSIERRNAFTLVELLVALMVTSIILAAVATLAYALGSANDGSNDTAQKQAQVRYATFRISDLIRHCKLICSTPDGNMAVWKADLNNNGKINAGELMYIERGTGKNYIRLLEFSSPGGLWGNPFDTTPFNIADIKFGWPKIWLMQIANKKYTTLIPICSNVKFLFDTAPPQTRLVSISFDLPENGISHHYQISTSLQTWAGNLLDGSGEIVNNKDDD